MKRCPTCNRAHDDSLAFCRTDGTHLVSDGSFVSEGAGTLRFGSAPITGETETRILPTSEAPGRATTPTTALDGRLPSSDTQRFTQPKSRRGVITAVLAVAVLGLTASAYFYLSRGKSTAPKNSIAVLPFENASGDPNMEYLSDGISESLINSLSQLPNLAVKARSTVFRYKGKEADPQKVGSELDVQAVLNGRVLQRGDDLTLSLELVDAKTGDAMWGGRYDRRLTDLVALQSEIARDVTNKLRVRLSGADERRLTKNYTADPEAYRLYLQGRFYWNKREEKSFRQAVEYFNQAVALDRNYALAYAGLADSYALLSSFGFMPPTQATPKAREFARQALSLDDSLAEPQATLGYMSAQYDYDFAEAESRLKRAIEVNPNYVNAHQWYGELLNNVGRFDEAAAEYRRALEFEPLSLPINWEYGRFLYMSRRYDEAFAQLKKTIELDPGFARAHRTLGELYRVNGDHANAIEAQAKFFELRGEPQKAALLREAFAKDGWNGYLRLVTAENSPLKENNWNWVLAKAYAELGEKDKAFAELDKAYENRLSSIVWFKVEPQLDPLRSDPRFADLMRKVGFPQ